MTATIKRILLLRLVFPTVWKGIRMEQDKMQMVCTMLLWIPIVGLSAAWGIAAVLA